MKKHRILFILLCSTMCLLLAGCAEKTADESQLRADLYSNNMFSKYANELDMEITSLEILKRQTTTESKTDKAWVMIEAASNAVKGTMYYVMTYNLYNDGWLLESVEDDEIDSWRFVPLRGVSDDMIANDLQYFGNYEILNNELDLEQGRQTITFAFKESHLYCDTTSTEQLIYEFGNVYYDFGTACAGEWGSSFVTLDSSTEWNLQKICGTYRDGEGETVTISDLDESKTGTTRANNGIEYRKVAGLTYSCSDYEHLQSDELLEVGDVSATDFHNYWAFSTSTVADYIVEYGYSVTCDSFSWSDVKYVVPRGFYITPDTIYGFDFSSSWSVSSQTRTLHLKADELTLIQ